MTKKTITTLWKELQEPISNHIKVYLLQAYQKDILLYFEKRLGYVIRQYSQQLPYHVRKSEQDDLNIIAQLELFESLKSWDPSSNKDVWPLAYSRITGAMTDHIRYITKSDPSRFYDWITSAAHLYITINQNQDSFEQKIESELQLKEILSLLSIREKHIILMYTKEDLTFNEISKKIKISESQISRIYKNAIKKIRKSLK